MFLARARTDRWLPVVLVALTLAPGCATYSSRHANLTADLANQRYGEALATLDKNRSGKDQLLYDLEKGLVLHYADRWQESNDLFQQGEELAADLYTRSISQGVLSLITSDAVISYRAEPFEMAMVPYYRALNYIYLGQKEEALVEARKASLYLSQYTDLALGQQAGAAGAEGGGSEQDSGGSPGGIGQGKTRELMRNNAFLQYFSGMLYEWGGEINDAFIAYRNAAAAYAVASRELAVQTPPWLGEDLLRTGRQLGMTAELADLANSNPDLFAHVDLTGHAQQAGVLDRAGRADHVGELGNTVAPDTATIEGGAGIAAATGRGPPPVRTGEVVLLLELGQVPHKVQHELDIPILKNDDRSDLNDWADHLMLRTRPGWHADKIKIDYWLRVAMPSLVSERPVVQGARVSAQLAGTHTTTVAVEDLQGRAQLDFTAEYDKILLKTILRALSKYSAKEAADDKGAVAGFLANLFGVATETADTRSWLTLPNQIVMARLHLPPGTHDLKVELVDSQGATVTTETINGVTIRADDWFFLSRRVF